MALRSPINMRPFEDKMADRILENSKEYLAELQARLVVLGNNNLYGAPRRAIGIFIKEFRRLPENDSGFIRKYIWSLPKMATLEEALESVATIVVPFPIEELAELEKAVAENDEAAIVKAARFDWVYSGLNGRGCRER